MFLKRLFLTALLVITIFNISAESGPENNLRFLWKYAAGGELTSSPAVSSGGRIYLYAEDRYIHCLDSRGRFLWKFRLSGRPAGSLAVSPDGSIYACTENGLLYAVNPAGEELWRFDAGGQPAGDPAISASGTIYFCLVSGEVYSISHTGRLRWKIETDEKINHAPIVDSGTAIYLFTQFGKILSYTPWGTENWQYFSEGDGTSRQGSAVLHHNVLYRGRGNHLEAVNADGDLLWIIGLAEECGAVMMYKNGICVISAAGIARGYSLEGVQLWENDERRYRGYPSSSDDGIYLQSGVDHITLLTFDGEISVEVSVEGSLTQPVLNGGMLIAGSEEWVVWAFSAAEPDSSLWSQRGGDASHGGRSSDNRFAFDESLYRGHIDYFYLKTMIDSPSADDQEKALSEIARSIDEKPLDRGLSYMLPLLYRAVGEGRLLGQQKSKTASGTDFPLIRAEAARLIGRVGDFNSVEILSGILDVEQEPIVCEALIYALGVLGTNYRNLSLETVYNIIKGQNGRMGDDRIAAAAVRAVELIIDYTGNAGSGYGYRILIEIYRGNYTANVRNRAMEVLRRMK